MARAACWVLAVGLALVACSVPAAPAADDDEMVVNPHFKYWSNFKPGATSTRLEKTVFTGPAREQVPDGIDEKEITMTLLEKSADSVTVQVVVTDRDFLGSIVSAPTKKIFPAKVKKSHLRAGLHGVDPKLGKEALDVLGKKLDCTTASGTEKKDDVEVDHKIWLSETVPGGIVKHTRTTKQGGKVVADTTIVVKSYKAE
jgi:hypothetical protein